MPRLSVVVPVYNVEQYLPECLDSLLIQDFDNFEVVLVNDGSPDGSKAICEHYCNLDARFCLISKENGGLSSARNKGIDAARGDYISFLDADDRYTLRPVDVLFKRLMSLVLMFLPLVEVLGLRKNPTHG